MPNISVKLCKSLTHVITTGNHNFACIFLPQEANQELLVSHQGNLFGWFKWILKHTFHFVNPNFLSYTQSERCNSLKKVRPALDMDFYAICKHVNVLEKCDFHMSANRQYVNGLLNHDLHFVLVFQMRFAWEVNLHRKPNVICMGSQICNM